MDSKKGYPFQPLVDSLFGECLLSAWLKAGQSEESLKTLLEKRFLSKEGQEDGFLCSKNTDKELIHASAPNEIRNYISQDNLSAVTKILMDISSGKYIDNSNSALDVSFELLEWILTGFEERYLVYILSDFLDAPEMINLEFIHNIHSAYRKNF